SKSERKMSILRVECPIVQIREMILGSFAFTKFAVRFQSQLRTNMKKSLLSAIVGFAIVALMQGAETQTQPAAGAAAPDFSLATSDGSQVNLKDFKGKWVVLYFYPKEMTKGC